MKHTDSDGFTIHEGHQEIDWSFLKSNRRTGRVDNAHDENSYAISPDIKAAMGNNDVETFENLVDGAQG